MSKMTCVTLVCLAGIGGFVSGMIFNQIKNIIDEEVLDEEILKELDEEVLDEEILKELDEEEPADFEVEEEETKKETE